MERPNNKKGKGKENVKLFLFLATLRVVFSIWEDYTHFFYRVTKVVNRAIKTTFLNGLVKKNSILLGANT